MIQINPHFEIHNPRLLLWTIPELYTFHKLLNLDCFSYSSFKSVDLDGNMLDAQILPVS